MAVVHQSIEDRRRHHLIAKHLVPFLHRAVGADKHTALLVAAGDQLEEQVPRLGFERQVAQFIVGDAFRSAVDQQFRLAVLRQLCLKRPMLLSFNQGAEQLHRCGELHRVATGHRLAAQRHLQVSLADSRWAQQHHVVAISDPAAGGQITNLARIDRGLRLELKALQRPHKREAGNG